MSQLTGQQFSQLQELLVDAFNPDSLFQLVRLEMGVDMYKEYVATGQPFKDSVFDLINALEERGTTISLIDAVIVARPNKMDIQSLLPAMRDVLATVASTVSSAQVSVVERAIQSVSTMMDHDLLSEESSKMLQELRSGLELIQSYKTLHDCLHKVQMKLNALETEARALGLPGQEDAADRFESCLNDFIMEGINAHQCVLTLPTNPALFQEAEQNWLKQYDAAVALAKIGWEKADGKSARLSASKFRSILRREPCRIDSILRSCAGGLDLEALKALLDQVAKRPKQTPENTRVLIEGQLAVELLFRKLKAMLNQHNQWQEIDQTLWEAEDALPAAGAVEVDASNFEILWGDLSSALSLLVDTAPASDWAIVLMEQKNKVDAAWKLQVWKDLTRAFRQFRRTCLMYFFKNDSDLKGLADEVAQLRKSIDQLLAKQSV
jgi:Effector-associated domain 1